MIRPTMLICLLLTLSVGAAALSIYDIQYTTSRGVDNSYPSPYLGKTVTLEGVVTATHYRNEGFFLSETLSGAWRGIYVSDDVHKPEAGHYIRISGEVAEVFGMTCIRGISDYRLLDRNRPLPNPTIISSDQLANAHEAEAYEGVYCRIINASAASRSSRSGRFMVTDGGGQCSVVLGSFGTQKSQAPSIGKQFSQILGVVIFNYGEYSLNPISAADLQVLQPVSTQSGSWGKIKSLYK
ncbi:MAG: hypothetical protein R6T89_04255 [Candidatus Syntrophosphaera sp.]|jgi:hypothetical protein